MTICLVTDRRQLSPDARTVRDEVLTLGRWLDAAVAAGIDLIQLREGDLPGRLMAGLARTVMASAAGSNTRVVVNDRADVAIVSGCDGVHLRGDGPPIQRVRELVVARPGSAARPGSQGRDQLIGRSVHSVDDVRMYAAADYLIFGSVFDSGPKRGLGLDALREAASVGRGICRANVIAIGGVTPARATECIAAGASGIAAIRVFLPPGRAEGALGLANATREFRVAFDAAATGHLQ